jgi:hypothetical protein
VEHDIDELTCQGTFEPPVSALCLRPLARHLWRIVVTPKRISDRTLELNVQSYLDVPLSTIFIAPIHQPTSNFSPVYSFAREFYDG